MAEESRTWVEIDDVVAFGRAYREILRAAETKPADLIVMGKRGRSPLAEYFVGGVTRYTLVRAHCDVAVVPEPRPS